MTVSGVRFLQSTPVMNDIYYSDMSLEWKIKTNTESLTILAISCAEHMEKSDFIILKMKKHRVAVFSILTRETGSQMPPSFRRFTLISQA